MSRRRSTPHSAARARRIGPKITYAAGGVNIDMHKAMRDDLIGDRAMILAEWLHDTKIELPTPPENDDPWAVELKNGARKTYDYTWTKRPHIVKAPREQWWLRSDHTDLQPSTPRKGEADIIRIVPSRRSKMFAWAPTPARARAATSRQNSK